MNKNDTEINFLLGLFQAGYKNAYMSLMDFKSSRNNFYHRIKLVFPNVGRLCLYQTFVEVLDEQIPHINIFYSDAVNPNIITKIRDRDFIYRAANIVYGAKKYFEQHPEYKVNIDWAEITKSDKAIARRQYELSRKQNGIINSFYKQK